VTDPRVLLAALPAGVRRHLDDFTMELSLSLGDDLVGILLHGSVMRGEYRPGEGDVDVVVVVRRADLAQLDVIGHALQRARYAARIEAMIVTDREIEGASDVFPLLYDEIARRHVLLIGRDPLAGVVVHDTHRRLCIEQELREAQVVLRRAVTDAFGAPEAIGGAVARKLRQLRAPLSALLALKGVACAPDLASVLAKVGAAYEVDVTPLRAPREAPAEALAALVALLTRAIDDVDALPVSSG
jgi:predicted nucleotidyltransferase